MQLKHHGILRSKRGRFGGYDLLLPADQITFGHILRIIDGPIAPLACLAALPTGADPIAAASRAVKCDA